MASVEEFFVNQERTELAVELSEDFISLGFIKDYRSRL